MSKKHTEGHVLTYLKFVTIASFDRHQLTVMAKLMVWETVRVTNWMACLCKLCLSDIHYALLL